MADFLIAVEKTLKHEGGYVWDKEDPGGETNFGISKRSYPDLDIKNLTIGDAREIYKNDYWNKLECDQIINQKIAEQLFDFGVNAGIKRAAKTLQSILCVKQDGNIGEKTLTALKEYSSLKYFIERFKTRRIKYYMDICRKRRVSRKYLYAWIKRTV